MGSIVIKKQYIPMAKICDRRDYPSIPSNLEHALFYLPKIGYFIGVMTDDDYCLTIPVKTLLRVGYHVELNGRVVPHIHYPEETGIIIDESDIES
ncbi:MAG: hypothetical protein WBZ29_11285 [Methanocella sp.]